MTRCPQINHLLIVIYNREKILSNLELFENMENYLFLLHFVCKVCVTYHCTCFFGEGHQHRFKHYNISKCDYALAANFKLIPITVYYALRFYNLNRNMFLIRFQSRYFSKNNDLFYINIDPEQGINFY